MARLPDSPERRLWLAVLGEQLVLALRERDPMAINGSDPVASRRWIGTAAFREVCGLAGLDAGWIERKAREQFAHPVSRRSAEIYSIRSVSAHLNITRQPEGELK